MPNETPSEKARREDREKRARAANKTIAESSQFAGIQSIGEMLGEVVKFVQRRNAKK